LDDSHPNGRSERFFPVTGEKFSFELAAPEPTGVRPILKMWNSLVRKHRTSSKYTRFAEHNSRCLTKAVVRHPRHGIARQLIRPDDSGEVRRLIYLSHGHHALSNIEAHCDFGTSITLVLHFGQWFTSQTHSSVLFCLFCFRSQRLRTVHSMPGVLDPVFYVFRQPQMPIQSE
jgi:hypothetical protein